MGVIRTIALGWGGAVVVLIAVVSSIAWQALTELKTNAANRSTAVRAIEQLAKLWLPLFVIACMLILMRVLLLA